MRRVLCCLVLLICFLSVLSLRTVAQSYLYNVGNQSLGTSLPIENGFINVNNGEIHLEFPLATHKQRGGQLELDERLVYDSRIWQIVNTGSGLGFQPTNVPNSQGGWRFVAGNEASGLSITSSSQPLYCYVGGYQFVYTQYTNYFFSYRDPSGTWHYFQGMTQQPPQTPPNPLGGPCQGQTLPTVPNSPSTSGSAIDGSGYTVIVNNYTSATVYDSTGTQVYPSVVDRNGNYYSSDANGNLIDTLGRTPVVKTVNGNLTYYDVLTSGGTRARYTVTTTSIPIRTGFAEPAVAEYSQPITVVSSIGLPDGTSYTFNYDAAPAIQSLTGYGELTSVTLPTGGVISYNYLNYFDSFQNVNRWLHTRAKDGGTTTYTPKVLTYCSASTGCQEQVTVTSPAANDTVYTFTLDSSALTQGESWNTNVSAYRGSATSGTLLQSSSGAYTYSTLYAQSPSANPSYPQYQSANVPITLVQTHTLNDVNLSSKTVTAFNVPWSHPTSVQLWDYYSGTAPSSPTQTTTYSYSNFGAYQLPSQTMVADASGNQLSKTTYLYDETTGTGHASLVPVSGVSQPPVAPSINRGNLTTITQWVNASGSTLSSMASYDAAGMVRTSTDPNGMTSYSYDGTGAYISIVTPPIPASNVSLASSATTDSSIGMSSTSTDPNGAVHKIPSYDAFNRPNEQDSLDGNGNVVAKTTYNYYPTSVVTHAYQNANVFSDSEVQYDTYGRSSRKALSNGHSTNAWYQQDTCYDISGNVSFVSYSYSGPGFGQTAVCSGAGDMYTYDTFGRVKTVRHGDSSLVSYNYAGRATQVTDENGVSRITQVDGLGRTSAVCEISSNSSMPGSGTPQACGLDLPGTGFLTQYIYDLANHKTTITQGQQMRVFATDALGRQTSVQAPESGTTTFSYTYNSTGLLVTRVRPKANIYNQNAIQYTTTRSQYDNAGRILQVTYDDNLTPTKTFNYDQVGNGGSIPNAGASKGRLTTMWNGSVHGRSFQYDALGRVTETVECLPDWCGQPPHDVFRFYGYDWQGNLGADTYATSGNAQSFATVSYTYNRANQLTGISGGQNNASGTPNIYTADVMLPYGPQHATYGNAVSTYTQYDSLNRLQGTWTCNGPGGYNCPNGGYIYGLYVQQTGSRISSAIDTVLSRWTYFNYDDMGRLSGSSQPAANTGYTGLNFSATYDRYGNRWSENVSNTPNGVGPNQSLTFNTYNNQMLYVPYDWAGNLIGDIGGHSYQYDAENNLISIDNGQTASFAYSALGERVKAFAGGITDRYGVDLAGRRSTTWQDGTTGLKLAQYYNDSGPVAFWSAADGNIHFEHHDWEGTERVRTGLTGSVESTFASLPFGENNASSGPDQDPAHYGLLDQDISANFGISHAGAREYYNVAGAWMSPDPFGGSYDLSNPQSLNRYAYVKNNPLRFTDPSGLDEGGGIGGVGGCIGAAVSEGGDIPGDIECGLQIGLDIYDFFKKPSFHGTLKPRPTAAPWDDKFGVPYPGLGGAVTQAIGLPAAGGCEFGVCGGGMGLTDGQASGNNPYPGLISDAAWAWALMLHSGVTSFPWSYGNWCGVGGSGNPRNRLDGACLQHDFCYFQQQLTSGANVTGSDARLQGCNQALCNVATSVLSNENHRGGDIDQASAALDVVSYFSGFGNILRGGNRCR